MTNKLRELIERNTHLLDSLTVANPKLDNGEFKLRAEKAEAEVEQLRRIIDRKPMQSSDERVVAAAAREAKALNYAAKLETEVDRLRGLLREAKNLFVEACGAKEQL